MRPHQLLSVDKAINRAISKGNLSKTVKRDNVAVEGERHNFQYNVTRVADPDLQIVEGEVYAPFIIDSHGDMMMAEDIRLMAHRFFQKGLMANIDVMHNNKAIKAFAVESFIARKNDPDYRAGSWVLRTKIEDKDIWGMVKKGIFSGYSFEALVYKVPATVTMGILMTQYGITEKHDGHDHVFYVDVNDDGRVIGGYTSEDDGHMHVIRFGTATEQEDDHSHRFHLNDPE